MLFSIPLSGLDAASEDLSVISNNLANLNTDGYKNETVSFKDLLYQDYGASGAGSPIQIGTGVAVEGTATNFGDGTVSSTGVSTNMAISGNGFFVTEKNGVTQYTRAGNFTTNSSGQLTTPDGQLVLGYPAVDGAISLSSAAGPLNLGEGVSSPASATNAFSLVTNLNADAQVGNSFSTPLTVYDSLGDQHTLTFTFTKTATNSWSYAITLPGADTGAASPTNVASGTLSFDENGNLTSPGSAIAGIAVSGLANGAGTLNLTWNLSGTGGSSDLTQLAAASSTSATNQNGHASGTLQSFSVDSDGVVNGMFSNQQTMTLGQVALATFANEQGLERVGDNGYVATAASGDPTVGVAGSGGRGSITGGAVELSNVDVAAEFTNMIIAQRGYEANAKVVTTFDTLSQDTLSMVPVA